MEQQENKKPLTPSTRCIQNLNVDTGFTKTGLEPKEFAKFDEQRKDEFRKELNGLKLVPDEIDLLTQQFLS